MRTISVLVVEDHPIMQEALITALEEESDLIVVGGASDGIEGVKMFRDLQPDVVLMDMLLPGMDGLEAIAEIIKGDPEAKILAVTSLEDQETIMAAIQGGALGYFPKTAARTYLVEAIHKVVDGVPYLPAGIASKLFRGLRAMKKPVLADSPTKTLTPRQQQILVLLGEGHADQEIAEILHIATATVRTHVHNILQRLELETRVQAVAYANRHEEEE
jgi:NarL family two-component system response regulator LiaR